MGSITHTLSSMVSNFVRTIPSMRCGLSEEEWSAMAWLNLTSWSTASLPTSASPTNSTKSGWFTLINCNITMKECYYYYVFTYLSWMYFISLKSAKIYALKTDEK